MRQGDLKNKITIIIMLLLIFTSLISAEAFCVFAETPAPLINEINSIGDFKVNAAYIDNRPVDENLAIYVENKDINTLSPQIIQAIRAQDGDKDIFSYMYFSLQKNGRDIDVDSTINIKIPKEGIFKKYQGISLFKIFDGDVLKVKTEMISDELSFDIQEKGYYVAIGILNNDVSHETLNPQEPSPTLQNSETAGIIPSGKHSPTVTQNNEGVITPGAFVFWLFLALIIGIWLGVMTGYILWGRYKTKKTQHGPYVIGE